MKPEHRLIINQAASMGIAPSEIASELLQRDLIETCVGFLRKNKAPFEKMSQMQQEGIIRELEDVVGKAVKSAITIIASRKTVAVPVTLKSITVDSGLKVVASVDADTPHRHALVDAAQNLVLLVLAPNDYDAATDTVTADADQKDLPLEQEATPAEPYDLALAHLMAGGDTSPKAIGAAAGTKRKETGEIILRLAETGVLSAPDEDGKRTMLLAVTKPAEPVATTETAPVATEATPPIDDDAYADACLLVQREQKVSVAFLKAELAIDEDTAEAMIKRMETDGIVSEENDMGGRAVFN